MPNSCEEHYKLLSAACSEVVSSSFQNDSNGLQAQSHSFIPDLESWQKNLLISRPESPLILGALGEYQFGLLAVVQGQYRQAFMALRLSLELVLGCVALSANELELRSWLKGERDIVWSTTINSESGVLSKRFVKVFYEAMTEESPHYRSMAEKVYRECSEYVHGNALVTLDARLVFQEAAFRDWHQKAKIVRLVCSFALCARYVDLADLNSIAALEAVLLENLGHLPAVRAKLGAPMEDTNA